MTISDESWAILIIGTILGAIVSLLISYFSKRETMVCYSIRSINVIDIKSSSSGFEEKIVVSYENRTIPRLSVSTVTIWNGGNALLEGGKLIKRDPLRISINSEGEILEAIIMINPNPECECSTSLNTEVFPNTVSLNFDFLDRQNGIVVRLLHTGKAETIGVAGKLKGVRLEDERGQIRFYHSVLKSINYSFFVIAAIFAFLFIGIIVLNNLTEISLPVLEGLSKYFNIMTAFCFCLTFAVLFLSYLKEKDYHKVPSTLKSS